MKVFNQKVVILLSSLAARIAVEIGANLVIIMSDVDGIYDRPPSHEDARIIHTFVPEDLNQVKAHNASPNQWLFNNILKFTLGQILQK